MENFGTGQKKVKEKSVYLLHFDIPRIIIVTSILLGVIIGAFYFGMNFDDRDGSPDKITAQGELLFDKKNDLLTLDDKTVSEQMASDDTIKVEDRQIEDLSKSDLNDTKLANKADMKNGKEAADVLTGDNINEIVPPTKEDIKKISKKKTSKNRKKIVKKRSRKSEKRKKVSKKRKRKGSRVVEVSDRAERTKNRSYYSIQVASYDRKSKANSELSRLKRLRYDAHISKKRVNGKKYYRVKIGPVFSKRKALNLLEELQDNSRYSNSYMTRE